MVRVNEMAIRIRLQKTDDDRISLALPYDRDLIERIRTVTGRRWHQDEKVWTVPREAGMVECLQQLFADLAVEVDPALMGVVGPLERMRRELVTRKYSRRTVKAYVRFNERLLEMVGKRPEDVDNEDVSRYLAYLAEGRRCSASTLNSAMSAIKFMYGRVLGRRFVYTLKRPRKDRRLPVVLSCGEVSRILGMVSYPKHRAILMLTYGAGVRVG
ncbi:MAG: phage integrase N-terminal SAM-like domain-containing protein [Candidatus Undinarchaeales archaeon]|jgi:hypothetical protein|nr:phage integrase N-terminal SAM-like domain-containing protein [Candidatus Undinarchaeales archaeon]MDP7494553.1 phage integrase N-terminal SAM-like domain-containing protein [Candidatus Undinarchaeales archaeon]